MCVTTFAGIGSTTAYAASGEKADVYMVDFIFFSSFKDYRGGSASLSGLPDTSALCVRCIRGSVCRDGDRRSGLY